MAKITVDELDIHGVVVDNDRVGSTPGQLSKAQNAVADPLGEKGSVHKRPGLLAINDTAGNGVVRGGVGVPRLLGSAGPSIANPFTDISVTIPQYTAPTTGGTGIYATGYVQRLGTTFDDESFFFFWDWNDDFSELDEFDFAALGLPDEFGFVDDEEQLNDKGVFTNENPTDDVFDITGDGDPILKVASATINTMVPVTLLGEVTGNWFLWLNDTLTEHTNSEDFSYPNAQTLTFPTGSLRAYNASGAGTGGADDTNYPLDDWYNGQASKEIGYPVAHLNGVMYYAGGYDDYTIDVTAPVLRAYDGYTDQIVLRIPRNVAVSATAQAKAIMSLLAVNGKIYISTFDGGANGVAGGTVQGSVYEFNPSTQGLVKLGDTFPTGHMPYALLWAYGRLWCGTAINQLDDNTAARVYYIRPGIDTAWTLDTTFASDEGMCMALEIFQGKIYAATLYTDDVGGATANLYVRSTAGAWTASDTGVTEAAVSGYISLLTWPPENGPVTSPTPALYAVRTRIVADADQGALRKFNGSSWSTVTTWNFDVTGTGLLDWSYTLSGSTIKPAIWIYGGYPSEIFGSTDGTTFTNRGAQLLPVETDTAVGAMGSIIIQVAR